MSQPSFKRFFIMLLLLAFTGQVMASVSMNCERVTGALAAGMAQMDVAAPAMMHDHPHADHTAASDHAPSHQPNGDCCKSSVHCLFGSCAIAPLQTALGFDLTQLATHHDSIYLDDLVQQFPTSLYRPPISR